MHQRVQTLDEQGRREQILYDRADRYLRQYGQYMAVLDMPESLLYQARKGAITPYDIYALGSMLESSEEYIAMCEEDGTVNQLGKLPNVVHDVVTALYANSPIAMMCSVQPIMEELGMVYFKDVVAQTTRGNLATGDRIFSSDAIGKSPNKYTSDDVTLDLAALVAATSAYSGSTISATAPTPIRKGKTTVMVTFRNGGSEAVTLVAKDFDGDGKLMGVDISGTINYMTGAWTINLRNDPVAADVTANAKLTINYGIDQAGQAKLQNAIPQLRHKTVEAELYALRGTVGLEQSFVMRRRFGRVAEDELATDLVAAINAEICAVMVSKIITAYNQTGRTRLQFNKSLPLTISYRDHKDSIKDRIQQMEANVLGYAGRGGQNVLVAGRNVCAILGTLPGFTKLSDGMSLGAHLYGMLDGAVVIRIPETNVLNPEHMYGLFKGTSAWDATAAYAPYMPLVMTNTIPRSDNPLMNAKAAAIWAATEVLVPNFLESLELTTS